MIGDVALLCRTEMISLWFVVAGGTHAKRIDLSSCAVLCSRDGHVFVMVLQLLLSVSC
jgi:hypothetical protein